LSQLRPESVHTSGSVKTLGLIKVAATLRTKVHKLYAEGRCHRGPQPWVLLAPLGEGMAAPLEPLTVLRALRDKGRRAILGQSRKARPSITSAMPLNQT
jgi:hypothetical protein